MMTFVKALTLLYMFKNDYIKISLIAGVIAAILVLLYFLVFYWLGKSPLLRMSTYDMAIVCICMAIAMGYYRDKWKNGKLHFWEGVLIGLYTNLIATVLSTLVIYFFIAFIAPEVLAAHITDLKNLMIQTRQQVEEGFGKEAFTNTLSRISGTTAVDVAIDIFIKKFLVCLLATGFIAAVLRKN
jgi:hypothetical protein